MASGLFQLQHSGELSLPSHGLSLFLVWSPPALHTGLGIRMRPMKDGGQILCSASPRAHLRLWVFEVLKAVSSSCCEGGNLDQTLRVKVSLLATNTGDAGTTLQAPSR